MVEADNFFEKTILIFVWLSLLMTALQVYLRINKIWKRKHEPEVADSQSIAGLGLLFINCGLWVVYYIIQGDSQSVIDTSLFMVEAGLFVLVGSGLWVKGRRGMKFWYLIRQALKLERKEADYLIKKFFKPQNADVILGILHQLAMIDDDLDPKELEILQSFAKEWNIKYNPDELNKYRKTDSTENYIKLRQSVEDYVAGEPPKEQAAQLKDMMGALIKADDVVSAEEELIFNELTGIVEGYLNDKIENRFHVFIVPQKPDHEYEVRKMVPLAPKVKTLGGIAFRIGSYYSYNYAELICRQYQEHFFTIVQAPDNVEVIDNVKHGKKNDEAS